MQLVKFVQEAINPYFIIGFGNIKKDSWNEVRRLDGYVGRDIGDKTVDGIISRMLMSETKLKGQRNIDGCHKSMKRREHQGFKDTHDGGGNRDRTIIVRIGGHLFYKWGGYLHIEQRKVVCHERSKFGKVNKGLYTEGGHHIL